MPQQTPIYGLPYLVQTDPPDIAGSGQDLAEAVEDALQGYSAFAMYARISGTQPSGATELSTGDTIVSFPTAIQTHPDVTVNGNSFTLAAGDWDIDATFRIDLSGEENLDFAIYLVTGTVADDSDNAFAGGFGHDPIAHACGHLHLTTPTNVSVLVWRGDAGGQIIPYGNNFTHVSFKRN